MTIGVGCRYTLTHVDVRHLSVSGVDWSYRGSERVMRGLISLEWIWLRIGIWVRSDMDLVLPFGYDYLLSFISYRLSFYSLILSFYRTFHTESSSYSLPCIHRNANAMQTQHETKCPESQSLLSSKTKLSPIKGGIFSRNGWVFVMIGFKTKSED